MDSSWTITLNKTRSLRYKRNQKRLSISKFNLSKLLKECPDILYILCSMFDNFELLRFRRSSTWLLPICNKEIEKRILQGTFWPRISSIHYELFKPNFYSDYEFVSKLSGYYDCSLPPLPEQAKRTLNTTYLIKMNHWLQYSTDTLLNVANDSYYEYLFNRYIKHKRKSICQCSGPKVYNYFREGKIHESWCPIRYTTIEGLYIKESDEENVEDTKICIMLNPKLLLRTNELKFSCL